jgi:hypothetical protein
MRVPLRAAGWPGDAWLRVGDGEHGEPKRADGQLPEWRPVRLHNEGKSVSFLRTA